MIGCGQSFLTSVTRRARKALSVQLSEFFSDNEAQQPPKQPPDQNEERHLSGGLYNLLLLVVFVAPEVGLEPTTLRLTVRDFVFSSLLIVALYCSYK
jgi:hypothetical protein